MILVLLGTQNNSFTRLLEAVQENIDKKIINDEVVVQAGFTKFESKDMKIFKLIDKKKLSKLQDKADLIITHGGVGSIISSLEKGKKVIVVPRLKKYNEHVNDHQVDFCKEVEKRMGTIIVVEEVEKLGEMMKKYDESISGVGNVIKSNNTLFCKKLDAIVDEMFDGENK